MNRPKGTKYTDREDEIIRRMYVRGQHLRAIMKVLDRSESSLKDHARKRLGIILRHGPPPEWHGPKVAERPMEETLEADDDDHVALLVKLGGFPRRIIRDGRAVDFYETRSAA